MDTISSQKAGFQQTPKTLVSFHFPFTHYRFGESFYLRDGIIQHPLVPFANPMELALHFRKHGHKFGLATAADYEAMADAFMFGAMNANTHECTRPNGADRLRHDYIVRHFGVACVAPVFIRTFYPISQAKHIRHGGAAAFFAYECARVNL